MTKACIVPLLPAGSSADRNAAMQCSATVTVSSGGAASTRLLIDEQARTSVPPLLAQAGMGTASARARCAAGLTACAAQAASQRTSASRLWMSARSVSASSKGAQRSATGSLEASASAARPSRAAAAASGAASIASSAPAAGKSTLTEPPCACKAARTARVAPARKAASAWPGHVTRSASPAACASVANTAHSSACSSTSCGRASMQRTSCSYSPSCTACAHAASLPAVAVWRVASTSSRAGRHSGGCASRRHCTAAKPPLPRMPSPPHSGTTSRARRCAQTLRPRQRATLRAASEERVR